jgi:hypothetical protein
MAPAARSEIVAHVLCSLCAMESRDDVELAARTSLLVGAAADASLQVWCARHRCNVVKVPPARVAAFLAELVSGRYGGRAPTT